MKHLNKDQLRQETTGCQQPLHFNNAITALSPQSVIDSIELSRFRIDCRMYSIILYHISIQLIGLNKSIMIK
jgi:hypothetical protein